MHGDSAIFLHELSKAAYLWLIANDCQGLCCATCLSWAASAAMEVDVKHR